MRKLHSLLLSIFIYIALLTMMANAFRQPLATRNVYSRSVQRMMMHSDVEEEEKKMSVKIIGGGLAGMATAYHLANSGSCGQITVTDIYSQPGEGGASAVAAGLMHPFTPSGKIIYEGVAGLEESLRLVAFAQEHASTETNLLGQKGSHKIMRPCYTEQALSDWTKAAGAYPDWVRQIPLKEYYAHAGTVCGGEQAPHGVFLMENAFLIDTPAYLASLWEAMLKTMTPATELTWEAGEVCSAEAELNNGYDVVVIASGAGVSRLWRQQGREAVLPFKYVRGQNLYFEREHVAEGLDAAAVLSGEYVCPIGEKDLVCGATHEYGDLADIANKPADVEVATRLLRAKIDRLVPKLQGHTPYACKAGVRVTSRRTHFGKLPVIANHPEHDGRLWLLTGFGSRGLIHHALMGRLLAARITEQVAIPGELVLV